MNRLELRSFAKLAKDFPCIVAWGEHYNVPHCILKDILQQAEADGAPWDAVYKAEDTGEWIRVAHVLSRSLRQRLEPMLIDNQAHAEESLV